MGKRGRPPHPDILTPREWQVLDLLRQDLTNEQIAHRLDISPATAKYHVSEILSKLGVTTREEAATWHAEPLPTSKWKRLPSLGLVQAAAVALVAASVLGLAALGLGRGNDERVDNLNSEAAATSAGLNSRIHVIGTDGSNEASLVSGIHPRWSPDGNRIAFLDGEPWIAGDYLHGSLYVTDSEGTAVAPLATVRLPHYYSFCDRDRDPVWSPDGLRLAYQTGESLHLVSVDGNTKSDVGPGYGPSWSPDSQRIAYTRLGCVVANQDIDGVESAIPSVIVGGGQEVAWSPDGQHLAFVREHQIVVTDTAGIAATIVAEVELDIDRLLPFALSWSPDGTKLAYMHIDPETLGDRIVSLYVVDLTNPGPPKNLVHVGSFDYDWSPDSRRIAYEVQEHLGNPCTLDLAIYIANMDGSGEPTRLVAGHDPDWSPVGDQIAFTRRVVDETCPPPVA